MVRLHNPIVGNFSIVREFDENVLLNVYKLLFIHPSDLLLLQDIADLKHLGRRGNSAAKLESGSFLCGNHFDGSEGGSLGLGGLLQVGLKVHEVVAGRVSFRHSLHPTFLVEQGDVLQLQNTVGFLTTAELNDRGVRTGRMLAEQHGLGIPRVHQIIVDDEVGDEFPDILLVEAQINGQIAHLDSSHLSGVVQGVGVSPTKGVGSYNPLETIPVFAGFLGFSLNRVSPDHFLGRSSSRSFESFSFLFLFFDLLFSDD